mmetsp:Transcript_53788/g.166659  ORF Transcript_53788/g.166659 Transcript_53788/m.166659 type:complete len:207 (+) Transcript_53788:348-968(+)
MRRTVCASSAPTALTRCSDGTTNAGAQQGSGSSRPPALMIAKDRRQAARRAMKSCWSSGGASPGGGRGHQHGGTRGAPEGGGTPLAVASVGYIASANSSALLATWSSRELEQASTQLAARCSCSSSTTTTTRLTGTPALPRATLVRASPFRLLSGRRPWTLPVRSASMACMQGFASRQPRTRVCRGRSRPHGCLKSQRVKHAGLSK